MLVFAKRKRAALRAHWLDVAIVVLTIPLLGKALAWLRLARFIRLARFGVIVGRALQAERRLTSGDSLRIASILTVAAICIAGAAQAAFASGDFASLWDGIWWAVTTTIPGSDSAGDPVQPTGIASWRRRGDAAATLAWAMPVSGACCLALAAYVRALPDPALHQLLVGLPQERFDRLLEAAYQPEGTAA